MKKILSMIVMCALLLAMVAVSTSAAAYFEQKNPNSRITVKKTTGVTIDGIISDGEYEEYTEAAGNYTEWYVAENASDYFDAAGAMAESVKWYFSWDGGDYFYMAATWDAGDGAVQTWEGGDYYDDRVTEMDYNPDDFLGAGASLNIVSGEISPADEAWTRLFVAIGENTATGDKMTGMYASQKGQNDDYVPAHSDFDFATNGTVVTVEYKIPVYQLSEKFVSGTASMFKASITLQAGVCTPELEGGANTYSWGVRLGQHGYNSDSGNLAKTWATFRLSDEVIPAPDGGNGGATEDTQGTEGTEGTQGTQGTEGTQGTQGTTQGTQGTTQGTQGTTNNGTTNNGTTNNGAVNNGGATNNGGAANNGGATNNGTANRPVNGNNSNAGQTADFGVVAALVSAISACGVMVAKKRK